MRVLASQGKNRLYIGNLPKQLTHAEVEAILKPLTKGELLQIDGHQHQNEAALFSYHVPGQRICMGFSVTTLCKYRPCF